MRVESVTPLGVAYPEPNDDGATRHLTLCRVRAEDGTTGWGEAVTMWPEATRGTAALIEGMAPLVVGRDPVETRDLWRSLRAHTWWYGPQGLASFARSAIDMALWDLAGKALGRSVTALLGGAHHERVPVIASTHAFGPDLQGEADRHGAYVADGYAGVKIGMGKRGRTRLGSSVARDVTFVRLLREAVGPDADVVMDRGATLAWDPGAAVARAAAFAEHGVRWFEEPCEPLDTEGFRRVRAASGAMMTGGGEREWDADGYARALAPGVLDVVGCDPGRVGGITGAVEVLRLVEAAGVWFNAHSWSSAIGTAASLALTVSTPRSLLFELKPLENPMQHELVAEPFAHSRGTIAAPTGPGLGIEVDEAVVRRYELP